MRRDLFHKGIILAIVILFFIVSVESGALDKKSISHNGFVENVALRKNIEFVPGEFIVKFKAAVILDVSQSLDGWMNTGLPSIDVLNEKYQVTGIEKLFESHENQLLYNIFKFNVPQNSDILSIVQEYSLNPNVIYAEPNGIANIDVTPNDPDFHFQYALHNTGQTNGTVDADIDAPEAWNIETGNENIVIGILDTGVDWDHPDLEDNVWINVGEDLNGNGVVDPSDFNNIDDDGNGFIDDIRGWDFVDTTNPVSPGEDGTVRDNNPMDFHGHGTHCSGIASASTNNNIGMAGVCWNCSIMAVRIGYKAPSGAGYMEYDDSALGLVYAADNGAHVISMSWGGSAISQLIWNAVNYSYSEGVILVAAAGNEYTHYKHYPAGYDKVIAVAATDHNDTNADFSNYGGWIDVAAPGVKIYSTRFNDTYYSWSGTSMATPHVAGLVGLILSKNLGLNQEEVRTILRSTTDNVNSQRYIGTGRINAYQAIQRDSTPIASLNSSLDDATVYKEVYINGTAKGGTFVNYSIGYGVGVYPDEWTVVYTSSTPVTDGVLALWNTSSLLESETYSVCLLVYDTIGQVSEDRTIVVINSVPKPPIIEGLTNGKVGKEYNYSFVSIDFDKDALFYYIEWGDGLNSGWIGPYSSDEKVIQSHTWSKKGIYMIKAKAKDTFRAESDWGQLSVTMPFSLNIPFQSFWERIFERFPHAFPILRHLMGY